MQFSMCIKEIRDKASMSQEEFAHSVGVSFATINRLENDNTMPSFKTIKKIDKFCKKQNIDFDVNKVWEEIND